MSKPSPRATLVVLAAGRARRYGGCKPLAPVGPAGEPVLDLLVGDALAAGFGAIVLVISPSTGPAIRYHVEQRWPPEVEVAFALQERPLGTVHAVLCAADHLDPAASFAVANADDLYGQEALALLARYLLAGGDRNAIVAYQLANVIIGEAPVTRGVCQIGPTGDLESVVERRQVTARGDGTFSVADGLQPATLDGDTPVSMNLWGFGPAMRELFVRTMAEAHEVSEEAEVLLPEVVGAVLEGRARASSTVGPFHVLPARGRCIGVTHPSDLPLVQAEIARSVGTGARPAFPFASSERTGSG
jgi:hypothetical protein